MLLACTSCPKAVTWGLCVQGRYVRGSGHLHAGKQDKPGSHSCDVDMSDPEGATDSCMWPPARSGGGMPRESKYHMLELRC